MITHIKKLYSHEHEVEVWQDMITHSQNLIDICYLSYQSTISYPYAEQACNSKSSLDLYVLIKTLISCDKLYVF